MRVTLSMLCLLGVLVPPALAQVTLEQPRFRATLEGFANLSGGWDFAIDAARDAAALDGRVDAETRLLLLSKPAAPGGTQFGGRVTVRGATDADPDFGELSLLASGQWGRFEIGERRGLPDVLTGYAPNSYQFVSAEFGPASGPSLDPDGGLQTALLPGSIAAGINALSGLGITAALFFDESLKAIYVSPRRRGFQGGISLAPNAYASTGDRDQLLQNGLVYEHYWQQNVLRVGGTYTFADGARADGTGAGTEALHSGSAGASLTLNDKLTLGASFTFNGDSGLTRNGDFRSGAYGYAFSINYNDGPWTFGGFLQAAHAEGSTFQAGDDTLRALEFGASYRASTRVRGYAAVYAYDFEDEGQAGADGAVFIVGLRLSL